MTANNEVKTALEELTRQAMGSGIAWFAANVQTMDRSVSLPEATGGFPSEFLDIRRDLTYPITDALARLTAERDAARETLDALAVWAETGGKKGQQVADIIAAGNRTS